LFPHMPQYLQNGDVIVIGKRGRSNRRQPPRPFPVLSAWSGSTPSGKPMSAVSHSRPD
jgi:hypothetical protein